MPPARIFTIAAPAVGQWNVTVGGSGSLSLSVLGNSALDFADFSFVELRGRPEHEGLFPLNEQPMFNETTVARARVFGPHGTVQFEGVALDGTVLGPISLEAGGNVDASADEYVGNLILPAQPFRVVAKGVDATGAEFRRAFPAVFRGQSVQVEGVTPGATLPPGAIAKVAFRVTNRGTADSFNITATDDAHFVARATPSIVTLGTGESALVDVDMSVPDGTDKTFDTVTVFARSRTHPDSGNSARIGLIIGVPDSDGDGVPDDTDTCAGSDL